jgi:glycosyltransferase involved in cell wall biosynthesis
MKTTVLINNYNYEKFLAQALESIRNQTTLPDRVILVDDGSTDDSRTVIREYINGPLKIEFIEQNNFGVAGHILHWPGKWLELHNQFFIVNVLAWKDIGCPEFGEWCSQKQLLPVVERSVENFHDDYTPLWIRYSNKEEIQSNAGQGWKLLKAMLLGNWPVITLSEKLRLNKFYYYPECETTKFENSIETLTPYEGQNWNQNKILCDMKSVKDQIWLFNSETMSITNDGNFDLIVNTASGFKLFDVFKNQKLNKGGKIIIYDFNIKSLRWYKQLYTWKNNNLIDCIRSFDEKDYFTWSNKSNSEYLEDDSFLILYNELMNYFGGVQNFIEYWKIFKNTQVKFVVADLYKEPEKFARIFVGRGRKFVNLSNIFSTDATTFLYGHVEVQTSQQRCLSSLYVVDPEIQISIFDFWNRHFVGEVKDLL